MSNPATIRTIELSTEDAVQKYITKSYHHAYPRLYTEINILATCQHENIISMIKLLPPTSTETINIVMEMGNACLCDLLEKTQMPYDIRMDYLLHITCGLRYLHRNHIIHFDLKSENVVIKNGIAKIIDFGSAEYLFTPKLSTGQTKCTVTHRPPEAFHESNSINYNYSFDIWSLGIIMLELFSGLPMYMQPLVPKYSSANKNYDKEMYRFITSIEFGDSYSKMIPKDFHACLNCSPEFRPDIDHIFKLLSEFHSTKLDPNLSLAHHKFGTNSDKSKWFPECSAHYQSMLQKIGQAYPKVIIGTTLDLLNRLSWIWQDKFTIEYINQAILLCYYLDSEQTIPMEEFVGNPDEKIMNEIVLATHGVLYIISE